MDKKLIANKIKDLISKDKTEDAIRYLAQAQIDEFDKEIIILNNRFNDISGEERLGVISNQDANIEYNKINSALIDLAEKIEKGEKIIEENPNFLPDKTKKYKQIAILLGFILIGTLGYFFFPSGNNDVVVNQLEGYIICIGAYKDKPQAKQKVVKLGHNGYNGMSSFLWIPDYDCLSGAEKYQVYIGPFKSLVTAKKELCEYNRKFETSIYGVKLYKGNREEFRCEK